VPIRREEGEVGASYIAWLSRARRSDRPHGSKPDAADSIWHFNFSIEGNGVYQELAKCIRDREELLLFFVHEPQAHEGRRVTEPNRSCACYDFRFSSSATTVPSTITSEIGSFAVDGDVSGKEATYEKSL
jgi:hypothetical protein